MQPTGDAGLGAGPAAGGGRGGAGSELGIEMFEGQKEEGGESLVRLDDKEPVPTLWGQVIN